MFFLRLSPPTDRQDTPPFTALYLTAALMTHSCVPNTRLSFASSSSDGQQEPGANGNFQLTVYAATDIEKGAKITHCFPSGMARNLIRTGTRERRRKLQKRLIDCQCKRCKYATDYRVKSQLISFKRCSDPSELDTYTSSLLCQRCPKDNAQVSSSPSILPADPSDPESKWQCAECGYCVRADFASALQDRLRDELENSRYGNAKLPLDKYYLCYVNQVRGRASEVPRLPAH